MPGATALALAGRLEGVAKERARLSVERDRAPVGGGSLPGEEIPSAGIELDGDHTEQLRRHDPPIIARVRDQVTVVDLRTVDPADDQAVAEAVRECT